MTLIVDSSGILAFLSRAEPAHTSARATVDADDGPFPLSPFVLTELDYLIERRLGRAAQLTFLEEVRSGVYALEPFAADDLANAIGILERFDDLGIGLADASLVVLAERYGTRRILTLDERHFRALRASDGSAFELLPANA